MKVEWRLMILKKSKVKVNDRGTDPCLCLFMSIDPSSMPPKKRHETLPPQKKRCPELLHNKKNIIDPTKALRTHPTWASAEPVDKIWWCKIPSSWWWRLHTGKGVTTKGISAAGCRIFPGRLFSTAGRCVLPTTCFVCEREQPKQKDFAWTYENWPSWLQYRLEGKTSFDMSEKKHFQFDKFLLKSLHKDIQSL